MPDHIESGRTFLSKGLLEEAKKVAKKNVAMLKDIVKADAPLIGIEQDKEIGVEARCVGENCPT